MATRVGRKTPGKRRLRTHLTRLGLAVSAAVVTLMGPATAIAEARLAGNHNEVMVRR